MKHLRTTALLLVMVLSVAAQVVWAAPPELPDQVTMAVTWPGTDSGAPSYFDVTVSGGTTLDGTYDGYCLDTDSAYPDPGTANVYSSYEPLPQTQIEYPENLDLVNWIINQGFVGQPSGCDGNYTYGDVQWVIWHLLEDNPTPGALGSLGDWSECRAQEILAAAYANGEGFVPGCGDVLGIILIREGYWWRYQPVIIEVRLACIGDRVWEDLDGDGIQDEGEPGIEGVTVKLYDCDGNLVATTTTDADGLYGFVVPSGDYYVEFVAPEGYFFSPQDQGTDDTVDSDADPATGQTVCTTLEPGENDTTWDAGLYRLASLGDYVWQDTNANGIQDDWDTGINGVTVNLYDCAGNPLASTTTADDGAGNAGYYLFTGLTPGCYQVEFVAPMGYLFSPQDRGTNDALDSDADPISGRTGPIYLSSGETDLTWDAGLYRLASLGDYVWRDTNGNGIQDDGDTGINGVTVNLYDCAGNPLASTTTADDGAGNAGYYLFTGLTPGCYRVEFVAPMGYFFSPQDRGTNDALDSDADPVTGRTGPIYLSSGETDLTWDAGLYKPASLGDYVWRDTNGNGIQDDGDTGINGVTVNLYDCAGNPVASTTTADDGAGNAGYYLFTGLTPGCYQVEFVAPMGYLFSPQDQGADEALDSDADPISGRTGPIDLSSGETDLTWDTGLYEPASIGDRVWEDLDRDGIQDDGEPGIRGVTVNLYDCDGNPIASTTTGADGTYTFSGLTPGDYYVEFVAPMGYLFSPQDQGTDDALDSDAGPTGRAACTTLEPGENDTTWDAGLYEPTCDLAVAKSCLVTPAPTTDLFCSDKIVATTLRYIGPTILGATVEIDPDKGPTVLYWGLNLISGETVLTLPLENGFSVDARPDEAELGAKTKIRVNGVEEVIHTSCSTPYVAGEPAPLDNPKGDPSPNWFVENFVDKDSPEVVELPAPPEPSDSCEVTLGPTPSCETEGKPTSLTFIFTGGTCADSANTQGSKFDCTDYAPIDPAIPVEIVYVGKDPDKFTITPNVVLIGEELVIDTTRADFHAETKLELYQGGALVQFLNIHTSCSAPLAVGDVFGSLELVAFNGATAGNEVTYIYEVTNLGDPLSGVTLFDIPLGAIDTGGPFSLGTGDTRTFQTVTEINATVTNEGIFSGFLANGKTCSASDFATVTVTEPVEPCAECKGGTTELTFQYLGTHTANVAVYDDNDAKPDKKLFEGLLQPGEEFTITPRTGQDDLNNDISIWVDGAFNAKVHTSCSQPIGPGLIAGDFLILDGRSKDNGPMCPLNTCAPDAAPAIEFHDREIKWDITNMGDLGLEISRIEINWPPANGYLDEVKRDGDTIHKGDFLAPSAVINSDWEGNPDKRTIKPGETDTLKFKFQNDAVLDGGYDIVVEFTYGCSIEVSYAPPFSGASFDCSKPIDSLTMIWDGAATDVWVTAWYGDVGSAALTSLAPVSQGDRLTVSGYAGSQNDVVWEIFSDASGTSKLGESTFHLSCSDNDMNDALDCGKPQGDGKDQSGFRNDWILDGLVDSDETLICTPP